MGSTHSARGIKNAHKILVRKHKGKRPLVRPRHRREDNIRMDLRDTEWEVWTGCIWLRTG